MADVELRQEQFLPGDQPVRSGETQIADWEHFDTPFSGFGQLFNVQRGVTLFNDATRCRDEMLCSLEKPGEFANDTEFHAFGFACEVEFDDPSLYEIFIHYVQVRLIKQKTLKNYLWVSRIGAGGGVGGVTDQNTTAFHLNNGEPNSRNYYRVKIAWIFPAGKTWKLEMKFLELEGTTGPADVRNPATIFNADVEAGVPEEYIRKLVRFYMKGDQFQDVTNT